MTKTTRTDYQRIGANLKQPDVACERASEFSRWFNTMIPDRLNHQKFNGISAPNMRIIVFKLSLWARLYHGT